MNIQLIGDGLEIDDRIREVVNDKITNELGKYLVDISPDLLHATIRIEKQARHGFKLNFDMRLPGKNGHIYSEELGDDLINLAIALRKEVETQIRNYKDRLQDYRQPQKEE